MEAAENKKIGLFGGTFDPVHYGHLITAEFIQDTCSLDKIIFVPTFIHPLKNNLNIIDSSHRFKMLELAVADNPGFTVSVYEQSQKKISYSIETVKAYKKQFSASQSELFFLTGADNISQLDLWKQPEEILKLCKIIAFGRPGFMLNIDPKYDLSAFVVVDTPLIEISSTNIRERVRKKRTIRYLVPPKVEAYIKRHSLYNIT